MSALPFVLSSAFSALNAEVKPLIKKLAEDSECDVRYFAEDACEGESVAGQCTPNPPRLQRSASRPTKCEMCPAEISPFICHVIPHPFRTA